MTELLEGLSEHSRYQRFVRLVRPWTPAQVSRFVAVSPQHLAVVLRLMRQSGWHISASPSGPYVDVVVTIPAELTSPHPAARVG